MYDWEIEAERLETALKYDDSVHSLIRTAKEHGLSLEETISEMMEYDPKLWTHTIRSQWDKVN
jgi:hypothetical protein